MHLCIPLYTGWKYSVAQEAIHTHTQSTLNPYVQLAAIHSLSVRVTGKQLLTTQTPTCRKTLPHTGRLQVQDRFKLTHCHSSSKPTTHSKWSYLNQTRQEQWENLLLIKIHLNISALLPGLFWSEHVHKKENNLSILIKSSCGVPFKSYMSFKFNLVFLALYLHLLHFAWFLPFLSYTSSPETLPSPMATG